jgi:hypothetical protein
MEVIPDGQMEEGAENPEQESEDGDEELSEEELKEKQKQKKREERRLRKQEKKREKTRKRAQQAGHDSGAGMAVEGDGEADASDLQRLRATSVAGFGGQILIDERMQ